MKTKLLTIKSLLVAVGMCAGQSAWAGIVTLYSQNYESAVDASSWTNNNNSSLNLKTGDATYGKYIEQTPSGSGNRGAYSDFGASMTGITSWTLEWDMKLVQGLCAERSQSAFAVGSATSVYTANNLSATNTYMYLTCDQVPIIDAAGAGKDNTAANRTTTWYFLNAYGGSKQAINGGSDTDFTLSASEWYHYIVSYSSGTVTVTIKNAAQTATVATVTYSTTLASDALRGFFSCVGRDAGSMDIDNILLTTETTVEVVSNPTINVAYAGANRTVTITGGTSSDANSVTTYYTIDGTDPTSGSTTYNEPFEVTADCTVKAITISSTTTASSIVSEAVTVGKLTLAAPTFKKTAYSEGSYTVTIADDQSGLQFVPASTTIKYRIGTTGDFSDYSSAVAVPVGKTLYAYSEAANYTTSSTASVAALSLPAMTLNWEQSFKGVATTDFQMEITTDGGAISKGIAVAGDANYFVPSEDGTNALTNANIGFYVAYASNGNHRRWKMYNNGTTGIWNMVNANMDVHIYNLTAGQIVKVDGSALYAGSGVLTALTAFDYGSTRFYLVNSAGTGIVTVSGSGYVNSISVYNLDNEIVGAMDYSTNYFTTWNTTPVVINAGETGYYKFVNHNNGGASYQNWYLFAANDNKNYVVLRADNAQNNQTIDAKEYTGTISSFPTSSDIVADLCDATVELTVNLAKDGATYTLTSTAHITKADGTVMAPDYVFTQTGLPASSMNLFVSVEKNWLEILEQAVKKNITAAGYATYYSNNALDFTNAKPAGLTASIITGATGATLNTTDVENVPVETPVLLAGAEGTYTIPVIATSSTVVSGNKLQGVHAATEKTANTIYVLMASPKVGFYSNNNAFTVGANTAYLPINFASTSASAFYLFDDGSTTAIDAVKTQQAEDGVYYNLAGQRVAQPTKGLYIVNGKKVVVK